MVKQLGNAIISKDQNTTWSLFEDYALEKFCHAIKRYPFKRRDILEVLYTFCQADASVHMNAIRSLQEQLSDNITFIHCLAHLVKLEKDFSDDLLDLYVYYCVMGISSVSPFLRSASLSMLHVIASHDPHLVMQMIGKFHNLFAFIFLIKRYPLM